jgi:hypothetical protein
VRRESLGATLYLIFDLSLFTNVEQGKMNKEVLTIDDSPLLNSEQNAQVSDTTKMSKEQTA